MIDETKFLVYLNDITYQLDVTDLALLGNREGYAFQVSLFYHMPMLLRPQSGLVNLLSRKLDIYYQGNTKQTFEYLPFRLYCGMKYLMHCCLKEEIQYLHEYLIHISNYASNFFSGLSVNEDFVGNRIQCETGLSVKQDFM